MMQVGQPISDMQDMVEYVNLNLRRETGAWDTYALGTGSTGGIL